MPFFPKQNVNGGGGSNFNGGTITAPQTIDVAAGSPSLIISNDLISVGGIALATGVNCVQRVGISASVNMTVSGTFDFFTLPSNMYFVFESWFFYASDVSGYVSAGTIAVGDTIQGDGYYLPSQTLSTDVAGDNTFWVGGSNLVAAPSSSVTYTIGAANAAIQKGYLVMNGYLFPS